MPKLRKEKFCKYCGKVMDNAHPNKKFCCTKHKDRFHNEHNPRGIYAHLKNRDEDKHPCQLEDEHSFEEECMGIHE